MGAVRIGAVVVLLLVVSSALAVADPYPLSDFETEADLAQWEATGCIDPCPDPGIPAPAGLSRVPAFATHGSYSCQMDLPAVSYPGMALGSFPTHDWSAYDVLRMDIYNPNSFALTLNLEISDSQPGYVNRYYFGKAIVPGLNLIEIDLHTMIRNNGSGYVDPADVQRFTFWISGFGSPLVIYVDYLRLEIVQDDPGADAARGIWKFDFGTATSPRWRDFFRVTASDVYPVDALTMPFGFTDDQPRYSGDGGGPDDLARDYVRGIPCTNSCYPNASDFEFRVDVPNGDYLVYVITRAGDPYSMPVRGWQVWAEGLLEVDVPMDSALFYSTEYYYRGLDEDYPLSQSYWEKFENSNFPAYGFPVTVADGSLDLHFTHTWVYALIVYPASLAGEMTARIAGWEAERQTQFETSYYVNEPQSLTFAPTPEETLRGYAAWPAAAMDPCYPDTLPPAPRPSLTLAASAAQGEYRALSFAIRGLGALTNISLTVTDLSDGQGHLLPSAEVEQQYVRYLATSDSEFFGSGVLTWKPRLLQSDFPISVASQVTKQFWLTLHIPVGTPPGTYRGTVTVNSSAQPLAIPITLVVWPLSLDSTDDMAFGWYYMSPDERYCFDEFPDMAGAGDAMLRLDFAEMKKHGFNSLQFPNPRSSDIDPVTGQVGTLDFSQLDRYLAAMDDTGFGGQWRGQVGTLNIANHILAASSVSEFDANFNAAFVDVISRIVQWGNTIGDPLVMYLVDEPRERMIQEWNRNFADTMQYCLLAHQVPGASTTVTVMADDEEGVDYTPLADVMDIMQTHAWPNAAGLISRSLSQGKPVWFYNTGGDLRMVYGFYQLKYGRGGWQWHYDWLDGGIFDPFPYSPFNNHWRYTYPSPNGPVPTLRYEWASQGITDYRYAATLERLSDEARASGLPAFVAWSDRADALLQAVKDDVPTYAVDASYRSQHFAGIPEAPGCLTEVEAELESYRHQIAQMIIARPGHATIGLYNGASGTFYLRNTNTPGIADLTVRFGPAPNGWTPIAGDWDGDGRETIGLYNRAAGVFYLRNANAPGPADLTFRYGPAPSTWIPIVGDWDGDGKETIGLFNQANGTFYLRNTNAAGVADLTFRYGPAPSTWTPIAGDWEGDCRDTVGLYNPANGTLYLRDTNTPGPADHTYRFGPAPCSWQPIAGDWTLRGFATIGLYDAATGRFYLRTAHAPGPADLTIRFGPAPNSWLPIAGDWDGQW